MATHERKIRIAWVETDAPPPVVEEAPPAETPAVAVAEADRASIEASREWIWSICLWVGACGAFTAVQGSILPAFATMFREVGVSLPALTEAAIGTPSFVYGLGVLSLLHVAATTRSAETRGQLRIAAFLALVLGVGLTAYALFLPLIEITQPL